MMLINRKKELRPRARVGEGGLLPIAEHAKNKNVQAKTFTSATTGGESQWLIMRLDSYFESWVAASNNFYFGQKCFLEASSQSRLESKIQDYVDKNSANAAQPMLRDKYGEYWILCKDNGLIDDYPHALTAAYDGMHLYQDLHYKDSELDTWREKVSNWVQYISGLTGPVDPPKGLGVYSVGNSTVAEGPPAYKPVTPAAPDKTNTDTSVSDTSTKTATDTASKTATDTGKPAKPASPWQIPAPGETTAPDSSDNLEFAPMPEKKVEIPWTPIVLGGGALVAIAYLVKQS